jgi:Holliday junction resolvasome RuvABC endonuclease subunit
MNYLALDQALRNTGYCIYSSDSSSFITYGTIKTASTLPMIDRLDQLLVTVEDLLTSYRIEYVFLEDIYCPRRSHAAWPQLLTVQNVLMLHFRRRSIPYTLLSPLLQRTNSWRKPLGIGSAKSDLKQLLLPFSANEHVSDSIGIMLAGLISLQVISSSSLPLSTLVK